GPRPPEGSRRRTHDRRRLDASGALALAAPRSRRRGARARRLRRAGRDADPRLLGRRGAHDRVRRPRRRRPAAVRGAGSPAPRIPRLLHRLAAQGDRQMIVSTTQQVGVSSSVQIVLLFGLLAFLPGLMLVMTGFTRILIVLGFVRNALGT